MKTSNKTVKKANLIRDILEFLRKMDERELKIILQFAKSLIE